VVLNLVINAIQAVPRTDARIRITASRVGARARLEVADNGPGVPLALRAQIFDPFFTTKPDGGTGLGLAISRQIVEEAGGTLRVDDAEGGGALFVVDLPVAS
jgi:signal transduction histidine kinase